MAQYTRVTVLDTSPGGDTVKQGCIDLDEDLTGIVAAYNVHDVATTGIHGIGAGTICGTTLTQTLTNKTLSAPTLTGTVTMSGATLTGGNSVNMTLTTPTLTGTIPASGATLSSPTITGGTHTNMTFVTPTLGTPSAGTLTNCTNYPGLAITAGKTITATENTSLDEAVAMSSKAPKVSPAFTGTESHGLFKTEFFVSAADLDTTAAINITFPSQAAWIGQLIEISFAISGAASNARFSGIVRYSAITITAIGTIDDLTHDLAGSVTEATSSGGMVLTVTLTMPGAATIALIAANVRIISASTVALPTSVTIT